MTGRAPSLYLRVRFQHQIQKKSAMRGIADHGYDSLSRTLNSAASYRRLQSGRVAPLFIKFSKFGIAQRDTCAGDILDQVIDTARAWNRQHHFGAFEQPRQGNRTRGHLMPFGEVAEHGARLGQLARSQRMPGNKANAVLVAMVEYPFALAIDQIVLILHCRDRQVFGGGLDIRDADFAQTDVPDQTFAAHRGDRFELFLARDLCIDAMQLPQIDLLDTQPMQTGQHALAQIFGASERRPTIRAVARQTAFGGDQ